MKKSFISFFHPKDIFLPDWGCTTVQF